MSLCACEVSGSRNSIAQSPSRVAASCHRLALRDLPADEDDDLPVSPMPVRSKCSPPSLEPRRRRLQLPDSCCEVRVHVYDLWGEVASAPQFLNALTTQYGLFHTGVEVYGEEWYFCGTDPAYHGVYKMPQPKVHPIHKYTRTVVLGWTKLSRKDIEECMPIIRSKWPGGSYHPLRRNCHHFTNFFCQVLGFPSGPKFGLFGSGDASLAEAASEKKDTERRDCGSVCCAILPRQEATLVNISVPAAKSMEMHSDSNGSAILHALPGSGQAASSSALGGA